jgi:hypothetical protein
VQPPNGLSEAARAAFIALVGSVPLDHFARAITGPMIIPQPISVALGFSEVGSRLIEV